MTKGDVVQTDNHLCFLERLFSRLLRSSMMIASMYLVLIISACSYHPQSTISDSSSPTLSLMLKSPTPPPTHTATAIKAPTKPFPTVTYTPTKKALPTPSSSATITSAPVVYQTVVDPRTVLPNGLYMVYWADGYYYVREINKDLGMRLAMPETYQPGVAISPDSNKIAFPLELGDIKSDDDPPVRHTRIAIYDLRTGEVSQIEHPKDTWLANEPLWSPNGDMLAYQALIPTVDDFESIYIYKTKDDKSFRLTPWRGSEFTCGWFPDGKWFAFYSDHAKFEGGPGYHIVYVFEADCLDNPDTCVDTIRPIEDIYPGVDVCPNWFPDGKHLAYACSDEKKHSGVCIYDVEKKERVRFIDVTNNDFTRGAIDPEQEYLAETSYDGQLFGDIKVLSMKTGQVINITNTPNIDESFSFWMVIDNNK